MILADQTGRVRSVIALHAECENIQASAASAHD
jgi:hypothetical protein